jgi:hypothetical protein
MILSCKQYVQQARDHHAHECDAYTYLEVLEQFPEEISLRKQG